MLRGLARPEVLGLWVLPALALLVRLGYGLSLPDKILVTFEADPLTYDQIARNIVAGNGFSGASFYYPPGTDHLTAFWDPLYPYFLAAGYALVGHSVNAIRVAQALLGAVAVALTYVLGKRLASPAAGLAAAGISAVYPFFIYYSAQLLTESLFMTLILAVFIAGLRASDSGSTRSFASLGALSGLAGLCRAEAFSFALALICWCAWRARKGWGARASSASIGAVCLLAVMLPWAIRNQVVHGQLIFTTTKLGYNLYKYYHPNMTADQTVPVVPFPDLDDLSEPQRETVMRNLGIGFMLADPPRTLHFMASKFLLLFKLTPSNEVNRRYALTSVASYGALLPFMVVGLFMAVRRGGPWLPVVAYVLYGVATKTVVFAGIRLRMQIEPFLILLAAAAIVAALAWLARETGWRWLALERAAPVSV